ncbi:MAG: NYN domain-containing protein [Rhodospirillales bacterium]|nr:NYN domain-containing protein [Rhodospirillales bacterium]
MRTAVYVDGFNLYYGCLKGTSFKWLDLKALFTNVLGPQNQIVNINYFTALVKANPGNPSAPQRQQAYIRALEAYIPEISVHYGHFLQHKVRMANANPPPNTTEVIKTEEKGSDVNLSVHLLNDAWLDNYDCAVIVSNDSDMAEAMQLVRIHHPEKVLGLITPGHHRTSRQLQRHANFVRTIRPGAPRNALLPDQIPGTRIHKPADWA